MTTRVQMALSRLPLHPLLIAAYAVLFLYSVNLDEVLPVDAIAPLARSVLAAAAVTVLAALLFRDLRKGAIVATALIVPFFAFGHVTGVLSDAGLSDREQLAAWMLVAVAGIVYAVRAKGSLPHVTTGLNVLAVVLIVVVAAGIVPYEVDRAGRGPVALTASVSASASGGTGRQPDIYFLVFDRYGSADAINRRFGIDDNDLYGWLEDRGFQVPENSHANYRATDFSLAATLNMQFLDNLTEEVGPVSGDRTPARDMIRDHAVGRFLKERGYTYYQLGTWYGPTRSIEIADVNLLPGVTSEFESVLKDTTIVPAVERVLGVAAPAEQTFRDRHREGTLFELRQLERISTAPGPKFVFGHFLLPHDPTSSGRTERSSRRRRPGQPTSGSCMRGSSRSPTPGSRRSSDRCSRGRRSRARS